ncbi:MAG: cupin domain-containing protein [Dehalococcoidia bacterium]|nr:cupin domain-containing protein [Dehalococcoidia bacterium]
MSWAKIVRPEDERRVIHGAGDEYSIMATGEDTDGHYFFVEAVVPPGGGPPPHIQTREEEGFYVTQGELVFRAAGRRVVATPGTFIHVPRGVAHSFKNESDEVARLVFFFVPAGIEEMFEKMAADPDRFVEIAGEYGVEFVDAA